MQTNKSNFLKHAFTIVELLVTIVIIGILAAMTMLSYAGISDKAITAGLRSDLSSASKNLKMYNVEYGYYPSSLDSNYCPLTPTDDLKYCLKFTPGTTATYDGGGQIFQIVATRSGQYYSVSEGSAPAPFTPIPANPTMTVDVSESNVVAVINSSKSCLKGSIQYGIRSRTNDGQWGDYSDWSDISSVTIHASDDTKYSFQARSRCYFSATEQSAIVIGSEYNNAKMTIPSAPASITANTSGTNTTWSWPAVTCVNGVTNYQYLYTISPVGYNSGWTNNGTSNSVNFTTSTGGQTYNVQVKARCSGTYATSDWSSAVSASYYRPSAPILSACAASSVTSFSADLCANITSQGDAAITDSGICWGTSPNPTGNCKSFYGSALSGGGSVNTGTPMSMVVSPDGRHVYIGSPTISYAAYSSGYVSGFSRDSSSGALAGSSSVTSGIPMSMAISPDGKNVYVGVVNISYSNYSSGVVIVYNRDLNTGALTGSSSVSTGIPMSMTVSPDGKNVYVGSPNVSYSTYSGGYVNVFNRNSSNGSLASSSSINTGIPMSMAASPDGKNIYVGVPTISYSTYSGGYVNVLSRNMSTGALSGASSLNTGIPMSIAASPDGKNIYIGVPTISYGYYSSGNMIIANRDTSTGSLSMGSSVTTGIPMSMAASLDGKNVYVGAATADGKDVYVGVDVESNTNTSGKGNAITFSRSKIFGTGIASQLFWPLPSGTTIYYRGYGTNSIGTNYSADSSFVTN